MWECLRPSRPCRGGRGAASRHRSLTTTNPGGDESWHGVHRFVSIEHDPEDVGAEGAELFAEKLEDEILAPVPHRHIVFFRFEFSVAE